jgi:hypothetical protein
MAQRECSADRIHNDRYSLLNDGSGAEPRDDSIGWARTALTTPSPPGGGPAQGYDRAQHQKSARMAGLVSGGDGRKPDRKKVFRQIES